MSSEGDMQRLRSKELPDGWGEVVKALTDDALKGKDSPIFGQSALTGFGPELDRLTVDTILNNERRQGLVDTVVCQNFVHFLNLFEDLTQATDPESILKTINESVQNGKPSEAISARSEELARGVIGKFCLGEDIVPMADEDVNKLRAELVSDKTAGWVFMFSLMRLPGKYVTWSLFRSMNFLEKDGWKNMVRDGVTTDQIGALATKAVDRLIEVEDEPAPTMPGEEPTVQVVDEDSPYMISLRNLRHQLPAFTVNYLDNPLLATHLINQHDPQELWKNEKGLNAYIENVLLKK